MFLFFLKRTGQSAVVLLLVLFLAFTLFHYSSDPINNMVSMGASAEQRQEAAELVGTDKPIFIQFFNYLKNTANGNLGISYQNNKPVKDIILAKFPATFEIAALSTMFAIFIGIPLGISVARKRHSYITKLINFISLLGVSLPAPLIGILLILVFSISLEWLPSYGRGNLISVNGWRTGLLTNSGRAALVLPVLTLTIFQTSFVIRLVRSEMMAVLMTPYILYAHARGLSSFIIYYKIALRNILIPIITIIGLQLGSILAFATITEAIFQWDGIGLLFINSIRTLDIPVISAYLIIIALIFTIINMTIDFLYPIIDPRIKINR